MIRKEIEDIYLVHTRHFLRTVSRYGCPTCGEIRGKEEMGIFETADYLDFRCWSFSHIVIVRYSGSHSEDKH